MTIIRDHIARTVILVTLAAAAAFAVTNISASRPVAVRHHHAPGPNFSTPFFVPEAKEPVGAPKVFLDPPYNAVRWGRELRHAHLADSEYAEVVGVGLFRADFLRATIALHGARL